MKKNFIVVSVVGILLGVAVHAAQGIYGSWKFPTIAQGPISYDVSMTFAQGTVTGKNVCTMNGQTAVATVTVPATITDHNFATLESKADHQSQNGVECDISVNVGTVDYSVSADDSTLTISMPGEGSTTLQRQ